MSRQFKSALLDILGYVLAVTCFLALAFEIPVLISKNDGGAAEWTRLTIRYTL